MGDGFGCYGHSGYGYSGYGYGYVYCNDRDIQDNICTGCSKGTEQLVQKHIRSNGK